MMTIQLDMYQACALGALVYCLGRFMVKKLGFLSKYCIPAPVAGGIVFALLHLALYGAGVLEFSFDTTIQTILMTVFFCRVGYVYKRQVYGGLYRKFTGELKKAGAFYLSDKSADFGTDIRITGCNMEEIYYRHRFTLPVLPENCLLYTSTMGSLMKYLKKYRIEAVMAPLFKMLEASFELFVPLVMAKIIDTGIRNGDLPYILRMGGILILLGIIGLACSLTAQFFAAKAAVGFGTALRKELFDHINHFSYTEIDTEGTATLITRMTSDVNQVQSGVNLTLRLFLRSPFIVFGAMIMAFTIDFKSAMVFVVTIPLLSIVVFGIMFISMPLYKKVQKQLDRVLQMTRENPVSYTHLED